MKFIWFLYFSTLVTLISSNEKDYFYKEFYPSSDRYNDYYSHGNYEGYNEYSPYNDYNNGNEYNYYLNDGYNNYDYNYEDYSHHEYDDNKEPRGHDEHSDYRYPPNPHDHYETNEGNNYDDKYPDHYNNLDYYNNYNVGDHDNHRTSDHNNHQTRGPDYHAYQKHERDTFRYQDYVLNHWNNHKPYTDYEYQYYRAIWSPELSTDLPHTLFPYRLIDISTQKQTQLSSDYLDKLFVLPGGNKVGELTKTGQQDAYNLGIRLKEQYKDNYNFISYQFQPSQFHLRTTFIARTIKSLRCVMAGLYGDNISLTEPVNFQCDQLNNEILFPNPHTCQLLAQLFNDGIIECNQSKTFQEMKQKLKNILGKYNYFLV
ncbi:unnamed protein product [Schistosoma mattheei]|uniref:Uncharacterized protein n=1 Tax=Schistosoma mattheei TaxID=31246 RepID=A0A183NYU9_9TREM|nr:unnamed protein product [Schistosoma mattheei]